MKGFLSAWILSWAIIGNFIIFPLMVVVSLCHLFDMRLEYAAAFGVLAAITLAIATLNMLFTRV